MARIGLACCDIISDHAVLIHHQGELQYSQIPFTEADWRGQHFLKVIQWGTPGNNEIGPHAMPFGMSYSVTVFRNMPSGETRAVDVPYKIDMTTGLITFWKSASVPAFSGRVEVR